MAAFQEQRLVANAERRTPIPSARTSACIKCGRMIIAFRRTKKFCSACYHGPHRQAYMRRYYSERREWIARERAKRWSNVEESRARERQVYQRRREKNTRAGHSKILG